MIYRFITGSLVERMGVDNRYSVDNMAMGKESYAGVKPQEQ